MDHRPVILIADDSEDIRNLFGIMLKKSYEVKFATNSDETFAAADTDPLPDLILLDIEMPSLNGYEVCAKLKANPSLAHIPVIFVTSRSDPKDQARGLLAGELSRQPEDRPVGREPDPVPRPMVDAVEGRAVLHLERSEAKA